MFCLYDDITKQPILQGKTTYYYFAIDIIWQLPCSLLPVS